MIDRHDEKTRAGPSAVPDAGSAGTAGPSRTTAKREDPAPGAGGTGLENGEPEWARWHMAEEPVLSAIRIGRGNTGGDPHPVRAMRTGRSRFTISARTRLPGGGLRAGTPAGSTA